MGTEEKSMKKESRNEGEEPKVVLLNYKPSIKDKVEELYGQIQRGETIRKGFQENQFKLNIPNLDQIIVPKKTDYFGEMIKTMQGSNSSLRNISEKIKNLNKRANVKSETTQRNQAISGKYNNLMHLILFDKENKK